MKNFFLPNSRAERLSPNFACSDLTGSGQSKAIDYRRAMSFCMIALGLFLMLVLSACSREEATKQEEPAARPHELVIYSPSPPKAELHSLNVRLGEVLDKCDIADSVKVIPVALPDGINMINKLPDSEKRYHLPIITTLDFVPAVKGTAPEWHGYSPANPDLRFVASLYDVVYGIMVFDPSIKTPADLVGKRIAVPARPSSVRWTSEALFRDGWNMLDQVTFVEMVPPQVPGALAKGEVDAVVWNLMHQMPEGYAPLLPMLANMPNAAWLDIDMKAIDGINAANPFTTEQVVVPLDRVLGVKGALEGTAKMLSFKQGLAAWASTPDTVVEGIVNCMMKAKLPFGSGEAFSDSQLDWPGLEPSLIHPAAQ